MHVAIKEMKKEKIIDYQQCLDHNGLLIWVGKKREPHTSRVKNPQIGEDLLCFCAYKQNE